MKKILAIVILPIIVIIPLLSFTACKKTPIKIGFSGNLTGTSSEIAIEGMYGTSLAVDVINEQGGVNGRKIELIIENDGNSVETAVAADARLVNQGVVGIIGHMISGVAEQSIAYINDQKLVMVSPTISSSDFSGMNDYFFTMVPISEYQSIKIAETIDNLGYESPGCLYQIENQRFSKGFVDDVIIELNNYDISHTFSNSYSQADEESFDTNVEYILASDIDCLVIAGSAYDVARFAQVLQNKNLKLPIFTSTWAMSPDLITIAGPAAEGIYSINTYDSQSASDAFLDFQERYIEKYGTSPTFSSVYAYEATTILINALKSSNSLSGDDIKKAIDDNKGFIGLQGDMTLNQYGDAIREMYLFQVKNGTFEKVE